MKRYLFCLTTHIAGIILLTACAVLALLHEMWFCSITAVLLTGGTRLQPLSHSDAADFHDAAHRRMHETK